MNRAPRYPKRLIEVDLPIREISAHARREKSIRHGHISTLHIWWARRPLAACRAVLCAALWPDPADQDCPERFRDDAAAAMRAWRDRRGGKARDWADPVEVRQALLDFIADFANWDNSTNEDFLKTARRLTHVAHEALGGTPGTRPLVADPFAGGGAIPLEALRIGADAFASDLNPVAVLLNKVVLEYIPKHGSRLAEEVRRWGAWVKDRAEEELAPFYPKDPDGAVPIAYLWARTIRCEGPGCGAEVPLLRSLWLARKRGRSLGIRLVPQEDRSGVDVGLVKDPRPSEANQGTVRRGSATCPSCGYTTPVSSVRAQLKARRGGASDAKLMMVRQDDIRTGIRSYRLPTDRDLEAVRDAEQELTRRERAHHGPPSLVPDEPLPPEGALGFRVQKYGMHRFGDLFTPRQALALTTLVRLVRKAGERCRAECEAQLAEAMETCLGLAVDRLADFNSSLCVLNVVGGRGVVHTFGRQALPMVWDFTETNPFNGAGANWIAGIEALYTTIVAEKVNVRLGQTQMVSATTHPLPDDAAQAFITDPPYYDAVPYADLSDFFFVWLRRTLGDLHPSLLGGGTTPKDEECIVDETKGLTAEKFEATMQQAMAEGRRVLAPNGVGVIVFAHKSTAGWEAQLQAMVDAGWIVTGSWPIDTERPGRLRAQNSAALASSVHLVCRPRESPDGKVRKDSVGDWRAVLRELPERIHAWMPRLAAEGVVGADAIFASLGPALEIFSRYSRVEKAGGDVVTLREYLEHVWAAVAHEALSMIFNDPDTAGLEEDARLTAMWLWTLSTGPNGNSGNGPGDETGPGGKIYPTGFTLEFDAARKIAQGLGAHLEGLGRVVEVKGNKARLVPVSERTRYLFGKDEVRGAPKGRSTRKQLNLFQELDTAEQEAGWGDVGSPPAGKTALDRVHQAMILFAAGRGEALKRFLVEEGAGRDARFWKLAQALCALYPSGTEEKRWVDGVLARKRGLGF
jgi:putative DNA methylase